MALLINAEIIGLCVTEFFIIVPANPVLVFASMESQPLYR